MSIQYIFFDLDGTLLPMDQDKFIRAYIGALSSYMIPNGFDPEHLIKTIWAGTDAMLHNDGLQTNEEVFWHNFESAYGPEARKYKKTFNSFYRTQFSDVRFSCGHTPKAAQAVRKFKELGFNLVLATQPVFPAIATETRLKWAGLNRTDFKLYTTYENSSYCKPNPLYYQEILDKLGASPSNCIMVGNDTTEDLIAETLGMKVFLVTDCLINKGNVDLSQYPQGDLDALIHYIQSM